MRPLPLACLALVALAVVGLAPSCARDLELPPEPQAPVVVVPACETDEDCAFGVCTESGQCDEFRCKNDGDCRDSNRCKSSGYCALALCAEHTDCAAGSYCFETDEADRVCAFGCVPGSLCPEGQECVATTATLWQCVATTASTCDAGVPPLSGELTALRMTDNLEAAVTFVRARAPTAQLTQINGYRLAADGTVDITKDYSGMWMYGFQEGDGESEPPKFHTVIYSLQGNGCGMYDGNAGNLSAKTFIPDGTWQSFEDPKPLIDLLTAESGCVGPAGTGSDIILYDQDVAPRFMIVSWKGHSAMGNPVDRTLTYASCE